MDVVTENTTKRDQRIALSTVAAIRKNSGRFKPGAVGSARIKFGGGEDYLDIPQKALEMLFNIIDTMAEGKSVTLIPSDSVFTTQQAADILKVSRPHLVKLLEKGVIPFKKAGTHRRIEFKDLLQYQKKIKQNRKSKLSMLAKQAQELNMGY
jgi:excisionase family DNA binding protein